MVYRDFRHMIDTVRKEQVKKTCVVAGAEEEHTLEAVLRAYKEGIIDPILIGNKRKIKAILNGQGFSEEEFCTIHADNQEVTVEKSVELVKQGRAQILVKGLVETHVLMHAVVDRKNNLRTGGLVSAIGFMEIPTYHKLIAVTDGGINLYPDVNQKKDIINNAVSVMKKMGIDNPKVAVLTAVENVHPKMPETKDAYELKQMNLRGEIADCIVEGPISYDIAVSREAAGIKGFESPVAGDADLLVFPDITSGNLTSKALLYSGGAATANVVVGTKIPIVFLSRSSSAEEKYRSIVLAAMG